MSRSGDESTRLVNVNNHLVPESTVLQDGDFVVMSRELLSIWRSWAPFQWQKYGISLLRHTLKALNFVLRSQPWTPFTWLLYSSTKAMLPILKHYVFRSMHLQLICTNRSSAQQHSTLLVYSVLPCVLLCCNAFGLEQRKKTILAAGHEQSPHGLSGH